MWKLVAKFKEKCLMFLLVIKKRSDDGGDILSSDENGENDGQESGLTRESSLEHNNQAEVMKKISLLFGRVNCQYERYKDTKGLKLAFRMIIETSLVELCRLGTIDKSTQTIIFRFFVDIKFLEKKKEQV